MKHSWVLVDNVSRLVEGYELALSQPDKLLLVSGYTGFGKTSAVHWLQQSADAPRESRNALYLQALPTWRQVSMLSDLVSALGFEPVRNSHALLRFAIDQLKMVKRTLIIDEFDRVLRTPDPHSLVEILRVIHDNANIPIVMVGEDQIETKLKRHTQFHRRIAARVQFNPLGLGDLQAVASQCCEIEVAEDLLQAILVATGGNAAYCCKCLAQVEAAGRSAKLSRISREQYRGEFLTGIQVL